MPQIKKIPLYYNCIFPDKVVMLDVREQEEVDFE